MLFIICNSRVNHEEIGKSPERITKTKLFINKYEWMNEWMNANLYLTSNKYKIANS